jgi:hypothetical protein
VIARKRAECDAHCPAPRIAILSGHETPESTPDPGTAEQCSRVAEAAGRTGRADGGLNPTQSGQDPMHQRPGGPGRRIGLAPGRRAALIRAYPAHPTCPIAGSFSPGLALCRRDLARRGTRWRIEPHAPVRAGPIRGSGAGGATRARCG